MLIDKLRTIATDAGLDPDEALATDSVASFCQRVADARAARHVGAAHALQYAMKLSLAVMRRPTSSGRMRAAARAS